MSCASAARCSPTWCFSSPTHAWPYASIQLVVGLAREREELVGHAERHLGPRHRLVRLAHRLQAVGLEALVAELARDRERAVEELQRGLRLGLRAVGVALGAQLPRALRCARRRRC